MNLTFSSIDLEYTNCNLCGSDNYRVYHQQKDMRYINTPRDVFMLVKCETCGLIYLNPRPSRSSISKFYPSAFYNYRRKNDRTPSRVPKLLDKLNFYKQRRIKAIEERAKVISKHFRGVGTLLDVGSAEGHFLKKMKDKGWVVVGVEMSEGMCKYARREYGIECINGNFNGIAFREKSFDVVTFWASLEHVYNPLGAIDLCQKLVKLSGIIVILVPNSKSFEERLLKKFDPNPIDIPRHLYHYSDCTLAKILDKGGFRAREVRHFTLNGVDRFTSLFNTYINRIEAKNTALKCIRTMLFNLSFVVGDSIARFLSLYGRSHSFVMIAEKKQTSSNQNPCL